MEKRSFLATYEPGFLLLTAREKQILDLLLAGCSNKLAALTLGISPRTVEIHRARVIEKLGTTNMSQLIRVADSLCGQYPDLFPYSRGYLQLAPGHELDPQDLWSIDDDEGTG